MRAHRVRTLRLPKTAITRPVLLRTVENEQHPLDDARELAIWMCRLFDDPLKALRYLDECEWLDDRERAYIRPELCQLRRSGEWR